MGDVEELKFSAEVGKVLSLVVHSLYTNKDIFLREVISNASDACDKLRYLFCSDQSLMEAGEELRIVISVDRDRRELTVRDNGIGMSRKELIDNLGTIASSGTQRFLEEFKGGKAQGCDLIGKFGVGFYSVFMVATDVVVESCKAGEKVGHRWQSSGDGVFSVSTIEGDVSRGTKVILTLREDEFDFLDKFRIEHIVTTYSDHVGYPIYLITSDGTEEKLNSGVAIWTKPKDEISESEHMEFFRSISHIGSNPWMVIHNKNEGTIEYINLLYVPSVKPFDLFHPDRRCSVKLYVNRVFITEDNVQVIPQYMRFLRGVIDSSDLPLNISRETLQNNMVIEKIKASVTRRVLTSLREKADSDPVSYKTFWENFGPVLKEGLCEAMDTESRESILSVCRFYSSNSKEGELISLGDYISRMKPGQEHIFYLSGNDLESAMRSPQIEGMVSNGIEVVLLVDPVDDFWTSVVLEYKGVPFKSVTRVDESDLEKFTEGDDQQSTKKKKEKKDTDDAQQKENVEAFIDYMKKVLGDSVSDIKVSRKLTTSLVCLAVPEHALDIRMERFLREQKQLSYKGSRILELNIKHPVLSGLLREYKDNGESELLENMVHVLFDQACIIEGEEVNSAVDFANRMNQVLARLFKK
ncbi:heat shock protein Hsp90 [Anaplasma marginale str. Dawn]|uniref:molecular chaperone HtpG n=1 Tax=Anaplasma marginale TaxID=770 RepID=UPI00031BCA08|nr:molecular chaperone HtpG [Anaplasma marginale]AGZ78706.1 heat shock protein Hsp90 [Anaplasma marginale str. Gypsy Plains]AGZ79549.1 heat shock protein Hsp90 [Anaplasma marginale str. Dawn]AXW83899.1 molecular chaperone HtpG [Anaplasma marginale]AXW84817.1 molecular chaperone HtpG [Anaplasma marginale]KAA8473075.1 molecular chaperone HtpG [Anaplasma marginale]